MSHICHCVIHLLETWNIFLMRCIQLKHTCQCFYRDGGYYFLIVVNKSLSDCVNMLYVDCYRWEDIWKARWAQHEYWWAIQGPRIAFCHIVAHIWKTGCYFPLVIHMSTLWWRVTAQTFWCPWVRRKPQDPPPPPPILFSYFIFKLEKFLSDCFLIWRVNKYEWVDSRKARNV